jgi:two-component system chemotaxis response regulator CheB
MDKIRVLIVDDASVVRRMVTAALNQDPALEVVGTAADGQIALGRLVDLRPDVVLLDLEMPVMDGLQTLVALRKTHPRLPVIMFSRHTQRGVEATVHALTLGADDYVPKPGDGLDVTKCIEELLIPKIKLLVRRDAAPAAVEPPKVAVAPSSGFRLKGRSPQQPIEIVVVGASTGGPNALTAVFPAFPASWSIPVLVVQHMPTEFTARLAERLTEKSLLRVREAVAGESVSAAQGWVAPGDFHMLVRRDGTAVRLALNQEPPVNSCRPSVDVLFRSAAETCGPGVLAVVLTGMGQDGLRGCECIRAAGGEILAQDRGTSVVWSMPGAVVEAGLADLVLPLDHMGPEIVRRAQRSQSR